MATVVEDSVQANFLLIPTGSGRIRRSNCQLCLLYYINHACINQLHHYLTIFNLSTRLRLLALVARYFQLGVGHYHKQFRVRQFESSHSNGR
jgi:hypothetical protein